MPLDIISKNSYHESKGKENPVTLKSAVSEKGQVTIPKPIRDRLGLKAGSIIEFKLRGGVLLVRKGSGPEDPLEQVTGIVELEMPVDRYLHLSRGPVE